MLIESKIERLL